MPLISRRRRGHVSAGFKAGPWSRPAVLATLNIPAEIRLSGRKGRTRWFSGCHLSIPVLRAKELT